MRDRDDAGRARSTRPRDAYGRPLPYGAVGVPTMPDDLALSKLEIHALEHQQFRSVRLGEGFAYIVALQ